VLNVLYFFELKQIEILQSQFGPCNDMPSLLKNIKSDFVISFNKKGSRWRKHSLVPPYLFTAVDTSILTQSPMPSWLRLYGRPPGAQ
jgi:hypothetical protein